MLTYDHLGAILCLPDLLRQRTAFDRIGSAIRDLGVVVVGVLPVVCTPRIVSRLYAKHRLAARNESRLDSSWLSPQMFGLGVSVLVVVRGRTTTRSVSALLDSAKGPSAYLSRSADALRSASPIADRCTSLIHTPDDSYDFERTLRLMAPGDALERIDQFGAARGVDWCDVWHMRDFRSPGEERYPWEIVLRVACRAMAILRTDPHLAPLDGLATAENELRRSGDALATDVPPAQLRAKFCALLNAVRPLVAGLRQPRLETTAVSSGSGEALALLSHGNARVELWHSLACLLEPCTFDSHTFDVVSPVLARNHIVLDAWEEHRFASALTFFHAPPGEK
jgi:hypothetical protein